LTGNNKASASRGGGATPLRSHLYSVNGNFNLSFEHVMRKRIAKRPKGIIRPLDPSDPRSIDHPSHKEQWLELARAIGRMEAREEFEQLIERKRMHHEQASQDVDRRALRAVLQRRPKGPVN
jgi:hypothetical protein